MKVLYSVALCAIIAHLSTGIFAQQYKMVELKPIQVQGWKYYYDFKRVESPFSLEIPLQALEDEEINARLRRFKAFKAVKNLGYLGSFVYLLSAGTRSQTSSDTFLSLFAGAVVLDLSFNIGANHQMKRAIEKYNISILKKRN